MAGQADEIRARYKQLFGSIPENIEQRLSLAERTDRIEAIEAIEQFRKVLIHDNPLEARVQQLVHFGMLLPVGHRGPARLHAIGALKAGASIRDLMGVCETAAIVGGMPAFSLGVSVVFEVAEQSSSPP
ncbi:MAG: carboxymuconolactone decarboxylase family protein [Gammaproteobacteria bacterium]|nr:carboxymuconolactone decarboxylase family protein [Gammaproteobacteria bacterium]MCZ6895901.1 carboxymuconolactone decarboxylase family protein [Gammaproteobacteria bacterium]